MSRSTGGRSRPRGKGKVRAGRMAPKPSPRANVVSGGGPPSPERIDRTVALDVGRRLRAWFRRNGRDLPWRRTRDPYRVLVSELMLQQTQVSRVIPKYHAFLERFPTLHDVAASTPARVCEAWQGLGYYARARNLHRLASAIVREPGAALPAEPAALRALPGIGAYTAGAVASFAFERRAALVDTNVARVLRRIFDPSADPKTTAGARRLWAIAEQVLPRSGRIAWTHNQAIMELGALVCTARVRHCGRCPVRPACATFATDAPRSGRSSRTGIPGPAARRGSTRKRADGPA